MSFFELFFENFEKLDLKDFCPILLHGQNVLSLGQMFCTETGRISTSLLSSGIGKSNNFYWQKWKRMWLIWKKLTYKNVTLKLQKFIAIYQVFHLPPFDKVHTFLSFKNYFLCKIWNAAEEVFSIIWKIKMAQCFLFQDGKICSISNGKISIFIFKYLPIFLKKVIFIWVNKSNQNVVLSNFYHLGMKKILPFQFLIW